MALLFLDTSALLKLYFAEAGSAVMAESASRSGSSLAISAFGALEFRAAVRARIRLKGISTADGEAVLEHFTHAVSRDFVVQPISETAITLAHALLDRHALRAPDALQLASCIALHQAAARRDLLFVCCDLALLAVAAAEHVPSWNPAQA